MASLTPFIGDEYASLENLLEYCKNLPKIELHAHINGSISPEVIEHLVEKKKISKPELTQFRVPKKLNDINNFFTLFKFIYQLIDDESTVAYVTKKVIQEFCDDGVKYLELRSTPRKDEKTGMTKDSYVKTITQTIENCKKENDINVKLILSIDRGNTLEQAMEAVDLAIKYREAGVVGVDLCGDPMIGHIDTVKPALIRAKELGFKITIHFGEVSRTIPEHPSMLSIPPDRVGHATHLDSESREFFLRNRIPIEMCMTSNVLCKTVSNYESHHIRDFLNKEHPCVLCTDDKGVFFSDLSTEYAIAASTFSLTRRQLFDISLKCIDCIFGDEKIKENLNNRWQTWWEEMGI
ncbi:hypothetical protein G9A89_012854 [Geosiphon pyriformis]|nr:hypothetical protein G9A89_012854 [Geosiphon pyriformis]